MKQNNQSSQPTQNSQSKPQVTARVRVSPATVRDRDTASQTNQSPDHEPGTRQESDWNEQDFRQKGENNVDVLDIVQPLVMAHEGVKHWHDALLSKVGLGEMNRKVWAIVDKMRDNSLSMMKRQHGKKNRQPVQVLKPTAPPTSPKASNSSSTSSTSDAPTDTTT